MTQRFSVMHNRASTLDKPRLIQGELYSGVNFDVNKYFNDSLSNMSFNFSCKGDRLHDVEEKISNHKLNYTQTSEQFVDNLLNNYHTFMNIGKYVDRIDKNITNVLNSQKNYSILLQNLRKDVEEFTIDYVKYLKDVENEGQRIKDIDRDPSSTSNKYFEEFDILEKALETDFKLDEFLNPKKGTKRWLEEQPEKLRVLIDEKKFSECVELVREIRQCELELIDYETKLELDNMYNYLLEKLTVNITRCTSSKDLQGYLDKMNSLGCMGLAIDTFLNWLSKKLKTKVSKLISQDDETDNKSHEKIIKNLNLNVHKTIHLRKRPSIIKETKEEDDSEDEQKEKETDIKTSLAKKVDKKIIKITTEYFKTVEKFLKIMEDYFKMNEKFAYSSYLVPWLKQEIQIMSKTIENVFAKVSDFSELKSITRFLTSLFNGFDLKGISGKYLFDIYFINNIKVSLEAIINFCMKSEEDGLSFNIKEYDIKHLDNNIKIYCVSELGNAVSNVFQIISDFIIEYMNMKQNFIGILFIEEYFFEHILSNEFLNFIRNKIIKSMSNNYDVKSFTDVQESMATSNQILINYGISILSIENLFNFFVNEMNNNKLICPGSLESVKFIKNQINETKKDYFSKLFKIKIESHFFKFFETNKQILTKDLSEEFKEPDRVFIVFFQVIKNLAKSLKLRTNDSTILFYFIVENQYVNFLKIIESFKQLDKLYDTEFNFSKTGIYGIEILIHGILFIYLSIQKILGLDEGAKFWGLTNDFIDDFISEFGKIRNINIDRFVKSKKLYQDNVMKYIVENRIELLKGY